MKVLRSRWSGLIVIAVAGWLGLSGLPATGIQFREIVTTNPSSLQFSNVPVGQTLSLNETVTNIGRTDINAYTDSVSGPGFSISGLNLPLTLTPGHSVTFTATFAPTSAGYVTGSIVIHADRGTLFIPLSGTGIAPGQLSVMPASINFGTVNVGQSSQQPASLVASGGAVTVTAASINNSEFSASGLTFPFTLQPGQSVPFTVTFAPQQTGGASANLDFSDAPNSPAIELLAGTGNNAPPPPSVMLTWDSNGSQVSGYNVFRGVVPGGPYGQLNSALDPTTTYTDTNVASGQTYYYVTTAVNSSGQQSAYSNQVTAIIP